MWTITSALNINSCEVMYTSAPNYETTLCQTWGNTSCMPACKCLLSSVHGTTLAAPISLRQRPSHNYLPYHPAIQLYSLTLCQPVSFVVVVVCQLHCTRRNTSCIPACKCLFSSVHGTTLATPIWFVVVCSTALRDTYTLHTSHNQL